MIYWSTFSWEAFATLFTGMAAIIGAVYIGLRQTEIQRRQTEILEGQGRLEALRYRAELFEKRIEVYDAASKYLDAVVLSGNEPEQDIQSEYLRALDASKFLFAPPVHKELQGIWKEGEKLGVLARRMERHDLRPQETWGELVDKKLAAHHQLSDRRSSLSDIFGDELHLGDR